MTKAIDEIAQIKRDRRDGRIREKTLRARLIAGLEPLVGDEYAATITQHVTIRPLKLSERVHYDPATGVVTRRDNGMDFMRSLEGEYHGD